MRRRGDWMRLNCGDRVCDKEDPRHCGRINAIAHGAIATVVWDNGWISNLQLNELKQVKGTGNGS